MESEGEQVLDSNISNQRGYEDEDDDEKVWTQRMLWRNIVCIVSCGTVSEIQGLRTDSRHMRMQDKALLTHRLSFL